MRVRGFAQARELLGESVEVPPASSVAALRRALAESFPALRELLPSCLVAVNLTVADDDTLLAPSDAVALLPPVSGG
jgi:molybdopterin converting factor small subunit